MVLSRSLFVGGGAFQSPLLGGDASPSNFFVVQYVLLNGAAPSTGGAFHTHPFEWRCIHRLLFFGGGAFSPSLSFRVMVLLSTTFSLGGGAFLSLLLVVMLSPLKEQTKSKSKKGTTKAFCRGN